MAVETLGAIGSLITGIASLLGVGSGFTSNAKNVAASEAMNARNIAYQKEENALSRDFTRDLFNVSRQNQLSDIADERNYTSPVAQRARLKAAGLNASLVGLDGNGNGSASMISPPAPSTAAPQEQMFAQRQPTNWQNIVDAVNNSAALYEEIKLRQSEARLNKANASRVEQTSPYEIRQMDAYTQKLLADKSVSEMTKNSVALQNELRQATMRDDIQRAHFDAINTELQGGVLKEQALNFEAQRLFTNLQGKVALERLGLDKQMQQYTIQQVLSKMAVDDSIIRLNAAEQQKKVAEYVTETQNAIGKTIDNKRAAAVAAEIISAAKTDTQFNSEYHQFYNSNPVTHGVENAKRYLQGALGGVLKYLK